jgi:hypothetical protein
MRPPCVRNGDANRPLPAAFGLLTAPAADPRGYGASISSGRVPAIGNSGPHTSTPTIVTAVETCNNQHKVTGYKLSMRGP